MTILNNYLYLFILDEVKTDTYYSEIRKHTETNNSKIEDAAETITYYYCDNIDYFGPYRFIDAIEDFLKSILENEEYELYKKPLEEIIKEAFSRGAFELY